MGDLEYETTAAADEEEEEYPLIREQDEEQVVEEYSNKISSNAKSTTPPPPSSSSSSSSIPLVTTSRRYKKRNKYVVLFLLITGIALVVALVPFSQIRISISITNNGGASAAAAANNEQVLSINKNFQTTNKVGQGDPSTVAASSSSNSSSSNTACMHVDYHTNRFDYSSTWCPNAKCNGTPLCYPCQRRWLIIVTVGRSASTTLTKMMALLPGVRMTGENNNLVGRFDNLLKDAPEDMIVGKAPAWFHNAIPQESWSCASQTLFTTANPPRLVNGELLESDEQTILGFKTIRLFGNDIQLNRNNLSKMQMQIQEFAKEKVATMNRLFPCARFVVNFRSDKNSQVASWKTTFGSTNTVKTSHVLSAHNDLLRMFHKIMGPQRSYLLDSTEWTRDINVFNQMIDWLGFSHQCHFQAALEYNTQDGYHATRTEEDCSLSQECTYLY